MPTYVEKKKKEKKEKTLPKFEVPEGPFLNAAELWVCLQDLNMKK